MFLLRQHGAGNLFPSIQKTRWCLGDGSGHLPPLGCECVGMKVAGPRREGSTSLVVPAKEIKDTQKLGLQRGVGHCFPPPSPGKLARFRMGGWSARWEGDHTERVVSNGFYSAWHLITNGVLQVFIQVLILEHTVPHRAWNGLGWQRP